MQTELKPPKPPRPEGGLLATKNGSILAAVLTAALAAIIIVVFLIQYRDGVNKDGVPTPVVVARHLIERGASADVAGTQGMFRVTEVPRDQLKKGAVTDPATLQGQVAVGEIVPGQQITAPDFKPAGNGIVTKLSATQRAITVPIDGPHGLQGNLVAGDHVDVLAGFVLDSGAGAQRSVMRYLLQDVLVLAVPAATTGGGVGSTGGATATTGVTLRVDGKVAPKLAFASDNGKLWLVLRPQDGKVIDQTGAVTLAALLIDAKPIKVPAGQAP